MKKWSKKKKIITGILIGIASLYIISWTIYGIAFIQFLKHPFIHWGEPEYYKESSIETEPEIEIELESEEESLSYESDLSDLSETEEAEQKVKHLTTASLSAAESSALETESTSNTNKSEKKRENDSVKTTVASSEQTKKEEAKKPASTVETTAAPKQETEVPVSTTTAPPEAAAPTQVETTAPTEPAPVAYGIVNDTVYYSAEEYEKARVEYWTAVAYSGVDYTETYYANARAAGVAIPESHTHTTAYLPLLQHYAYEYFVNGDYRCCEKSDEWAYANGFGEVAGGYMSVYRLNNDFEFLTCENITDMYYVVGGVCFYGTDWHMP